MENQWNPGRWNPENLVIVEARKINKNQSRSVRENEPEALRKDKQRG